MATQPKRKTDDELSLRVRRWEESDNKPDWFNPAMVHIVARLIWMRADEKPVEISWQSLADSGGCSADHIRDAIRQLAGANPEKRKFVTSTQREGRSNFVSLHNEYNKHLSITPLVTEHVERVVDNYLAWQNHNRSEMSKYQKHLRDIKGYRDRQINLVARLAQRRGIDHVIRMINVAGNSSTYRKHVLASLHGLRKYWTPLSELVDQKHGGAR